MSNKPGFLNEYSPGQQGVFWVTIVLFAVTLLVTLAHVFENFLAIVSVFFLAFVMFALCFIVLSFVANGGVVWGKKAKEFYKEHATDEQRQRIDHQSRWTFVLLFLWIGIVLCFVVVTSTLHLLKDNKAIYLLLLPGLLTPTPLLGMALRVRGWRKERQAQEGKKQEKKQE